MIQRVQAATDTQLLEAFTTGSPEKTLGFYTVIFAGVQIGLALGLQRWHPFSCGCQ
jgi:hypothetical protein